MIFGSRNVAQTVSKALTLRQFLCHSSALALASMIPFGAQAAEGQDATMATPTHMTVPVLPAPRTVMHVPRTQSSTAVPSGAQVVAGQAIVTTPTQNNTLITQSSDKAIINWDDFSIGSGASVHFANGSGATLNRVTGQQVSTIDGSLTATGSVYLLNRNGVIVGKDGVISVGGSFVATTLDLKDADFLKGGDLSFTGASDFSVVNLGKIGALGGDVVLMAQTVRNEGAITAPKGTAALLGGTEITLRDQTLDGGQFSIKPSLNAAIVMQSGVIEAARAELRAEGGNIYALAGNTQSIIRATDVTTGAGGKIYLSAANITVDANATLDASAKDNGNGGEVMVMASDSLNFQGKALAKGGAQTGNGGFVETSGGLSVDFNDAKIDTSAQNGTTGTWLIDPFDLTVNEAAANTISNNLATSNVTLATTATGTAGPGTATSGQGDITINSAISWSSANRLTLDAYHGVNILAPITVAGAGAVSIVTNHGGAGGDYDFGLSDAGFAGTLSFTGTAGTGQPLTINGQPYTLLYSMSDLAGIDGKNGNFALAKSVDAKATTYNKVVVGTFGGKFTGLGNTLSNLKVNNSRAALAALFGSLTGETTVRDFGLTNASIIGEFYVGSLVGINSGKIQNVYSDGTVVGREFVGGLVAFNGGSLINVHSSSTTTSTGGNAGGLVGINQGGLINSSYATGSVSGTKVGGLVGLNVNGFVSASSIDSSFSTGSVTGQIAGGLVGYNNSKINNAFATGMVTVKSSLAQYGGGLVGQNEGGTVNSAYATGLVSGQTGDAILGGLFGSHRGRLEKVYWDINTTSLLAGAGGNNAGIGTGLTTAQLQGTLPAGFDPVIWGTGPGLYPYLKWQYPTAPTADQKVSGFAFGADGAAVSGANIGLYLGGSLLGIASSGANGYYYYLAPTNTVTTTTPIGGTITLSGSSAVSGASFTDHPTITDGDVTNFNLTAGTFNIATSALSYSALQTQLATTFGAVNFNQLKTVLAATTQKIEATTAFSMDHSQWGQGSLGLKTLGGDISIDHDLTFNGTSGLSLDSYHSVNILKPVTIAGAGAVNIVTNNGGTGGDYDFGLSDAGFAGSLSFYNTNSNLNINGEVYKLLYSMGELGNISNLTIQNYALARSLSSSEVYISSVTYELKGKFTGLGNSISNMQITAGDASPYNGLFGILSGTVRDIGLESGEMILGDHSSYTGSLVGNNLGGTIKNAYSKVSLIAGDFALHTGGLIGGSGGGEVHHVNAMGDVTVGTEAKNTGGLVGSIDNLSFARADGNITSAPNTDSYSMNTGGLIGFSNGVVSSSYATGEVTGAWGTGGLIGEFGGILIISSSATGKVIGKDSTGGLIGSNMDKNGTYLTRIVDSFATGNVIGQDQSGIYSVMATGGLIGRVGYFTNIENSFATGSVTGRFATGGLVGDGGFGGDKNYITNSYATGNVSGEDSTGGLVGYNNNSDFNITRSFATGNVTGNFFTGGLIGLGLGDADGHSASVSESYATGNVSGNSYTGGFIGAYLSVKITDAYATGNVSGNTNTGGLAGASFFLQHDNSYPITSISNSFATGIVNGGESTGGVMGAISNVRTGIVSVCGIDTTCRISNLYWDTQTSGLTTSAGGTGLTTAQLQGTLPTGFDPAIWGTGPGLYPYLKAFGAPAQVISGFTYNADNTAAQGASIGLFNNGLNIGSTTSGANGYYYHLNQSGLIGGNTPLGATLTLNGANGVSGASFTDHPNLTASNVTNFNLTAGTFNIDTSALSYSALQTQLANTFGAVNFNQLKTVLAVATQKIEATTTFGMDQSQWGQGSLGLKTLGGDITIDHDLTFTGSSGLSLDSYHSVNILKPVTIAGAGAVNIVTNHGGTGGDYDFGLSDAGFAGSLSFTGTPNTGQSLNINGTIYSLMYSMDELQNDKNGAYALANSIDASGKIYTDAVIKESRGTFAGLGNTISNLTIQNINIDYAGLIGTNFGTVRNIAVKDARISGRDSIGVLIGNNYGSINDVYTTGEVSGHYYVGGVIGQSNSGAITNVFSRANIMGNSAIGGIIGSNDNSVVKNAHAKGSVSASPEHEGGSDGSSAGGLIGTDYRGVIENSSASGNIQGNGSIGGLIGSATQTSVEKSFALGSASGSNVVGGLIGNSSQASIKNSYAHGNVSVVYFYGGGLIGYNTGRIESSYSKGSVSGTLTRLNDYYLGGLVGDNRGVVIDSYWDTHTSGLTISAGGTGLTTAQLQGTLPAGFDPTIWGTGPGLYPYLKWQYPTAPTSSQRVSGFAFGADGTAVSGANIGLYLGGSLLGNASSGANGYYYYLAPTNTVTTTTPIGGTITLSGSSAVSGASFTDHPTITDGDVTNFNLTAGTFKIDTGAASYSALQTALNGTFGTTELSALQTLLDQAALKISARNAFGIDQTLSRAGLINVQSDGDLTIASNGSVVSTASGDAVTLAANGAFINQGGANAVTASNGRWLIYSNTPQGSTADVTGNLMGKAYYGTAYDFATGTFASSINAGNRFVHAYQPLLTVTADTKSLVYNGSIRTDSHTITGYIGQDAENDLIEGTLAGMTTTSKNVGDYVITPTGQLSSDLNYGFRYVAGTLSITPRSLLISLLGNVTRTYDGTNVATLSLDNYGLSDGYVSGDDLNIDVPETGTFDTKNAGSGKVVTVSGIALSGADALNYTINGSASGAIGTIERALLTIAAVTDTKTYNGTTTSNLTPTVNGLMTGDSLTGLSQAFDNKNAGARTLLVGSGFVLNDGNNGDNYSVTTTSAFGTINRAALIATLTGSVVRTYDGTNVATLSASNYSLSGAIVGDDVGLNNPTTGTFDNKNAGSGKVVTVNGIALSGADALNYTVNVSASGAIGTVDQALLTIAAVSDTKTYNGTTTSNLTPMVNGLMTGDSLTGLSQAFDSKNAGARTINVGSGYVLSDGNNGGNYRVTTTSALGTINRAALIATLTGSVVRTYDGTNVATLSGSNYSLSGAVSGDDVGLNNPPSGTFDNKNAGSGKVVTVNGIALSGADALNYTINSSASGAIGTINRRALTIAADNLIKNIGSSDPAFTYAVTQGSLVAGDSLTGALTRVSGEGLGNYDILKGSLDSPNYAIVFVNGVLTIKAPALQNSPNVVLVTQQNTPPPVIPPPAIGGNNAPPPATPDTASADCNTAGTCPPLPYPANTNFGPNIRLKRAP